VPKGLRFPDQTSPGAHLLPASQSPPQGIKCPEIAVTDRSLHAEPKVENNRTDSLMPPTCPVKNPLCGFGLLKQNRVVDVKFRLVARREMAVLPPHGR
jgi:hypothetical protein